MIFPLRVTGILRGEIVRTHPAPQCACLPACPWIDPSAPHVLAGKTRQRQDALGRKQKQKDRDRDE